MSFADVEGGYGSTLTGNAYSTNYDAEYVRCNDVITSNLVHLTNKVNTFSKTVNLIGTKKDNHDLRAKVHNLTEDCRNLARDTQVALKKLCSIAGDSGRENQQRRLQQAKLSKDFKAVLKKFQEISKISADKTRACLLDAKEHGTSQPSAGFQTAPIAQPEEEDLEREGLLNTQRQQHLQIENDLMLNDALIQEREEGIREIESTMVEVNEIFKDLATLVVQQGSIIDNIESNIAVTADQTGSAVTHLRKAAGYQKSARKKMCCLIVILVCLGVVAAVVIGSSLGIN